MVRSDNKVLIPAICVGSGSERTTRVFSMGFIAKHRSRLALLACLAVGAYLRFVDLGGAVVWEDEAVAYKSARIDGPSALLKNLIATDATRAPLYLLAVQGLFTIFGKSLLVGRMLSAVCGVAGIA